MIIKMMESFISMRLLRLWRHSFYDAKQGTGPELPSGPGELNEILSAAEWRLRDLENYDAKHSTSLLDRVQACFEGGIVVTTTYSGCGGGESACSLLAAALAHRKPDCKMELTFFSACDIGKLQQKVLLANSGLAHVFTDVTHRVRPEVKKSMENVLHKRLSEFEVVKKQLSEDHGSSCLSMSARQ